ncbi:NAD(P)/FAD-dependent oxidoreductase [Haliangium ochraceum]|uniref:NADH:ubiquinone reductase (non-electrogenic) n=1 Tax=Haliangium ochraceum (strain DSM 14365 / JCM 11303 / SMP-2) TaxID=502025 RepID=D0LIZ4_HALO1|nr:NAD(P)/FAD-dependent oxidoreductase [Haliangium ochraceum]ACY13023.1 FAD-dependent pyridine nucleotide-disulphide oxidoreductase [Haliangium ochraceum DSM 14365]
MATREHTSEYSGARPRVVIIGGGFGGLYAARTLAGSDVEVLVIDRENFHTFTPLLYQVATSALDPSEIAYPLRTIFRKEKNIRCLRGEVCELRPGAKRVVVEVEGQRQEEPYDYLILAAGSVTNFFGNDNIAARSFDLKALGDAVRLRNHILKLFERATWTPDPEARLALTTMVVVGGGPTGLETAGALYELYNNVLAKEFPGQDLEVRVLLVEAGEELLDPYPPSLRQAALEQVRSLGVDVVFKNPVVDVTPEHVELKDGTRIATCTLVWAAGVSASPLGDQLGVDLAWQKRVPVEPSLQIKGEPDIYCVGDMAYLEDEAGKPYPGVIQVARQQSIRAAENILNRLSQVEQEPFQYRDLGTMATIGRRRAVAWLFNKIRLRGILAWLAWVVLHLVMLMGFRNRLNVFVNWMWNYLTYDRSVRIILEPQQGAPSARPDVPRELGKPAPFGPETMADVPVGISDASEIQERADADAASA